MAGSSDIEKIIVSALGSIQTPEGKSLVDGGHIAGLRGEGSTLIVACRNPGWMEPIQQRIERQISAAVQSQISQIEKVVVEWRNETVGSAKEAQAATASEQPLQIKHVIAVGSGKGGVGKSTMAASLAYGLMHRGHKVGLMDADVYGPSIPHMLGVHETPRIANNKYLPPIVDTMPLMSMGFLVAPEQAVVWRGPMLHKAVADFLFRVEWGALDYLVVDLPPGTGDIILSLSQQIPVSGGVIVCTPQEVALLDARKALTMLGAVKIPCLGIIENMSYFIDPKSGNRTDIFGHGGAEEWARQAGVPFLGAVPLDMSIRINGDAGHVRDNFKPGSSSREILLGLADKLVAQVSANAAPPLPTIEIVD